MACNCRITRNITEKFLRSPTVSIREERSEHACEDCNVYVNLTVMVTHRSTNLRPIQFIFPYEKFHTVHTTYYCMWVISCVTVDTEHVLNVFQEKKKSVDDQS